MSTNDDGKSFFARYIDPEEKERQQQRPEPEPEAAAESGSENLFELPKNKFIRPNVDAESLQLPLVRFPGLKRVEPEREMLCAGWTAFCKEVAPGPAPVIAQKDRVPYYISGVLRDAELKNERLRKQRIKAGQSTIGRQRSSAHVVSIGPAILFDDDGNVLARISKLRALGWASLVYSSHSYGSVKAGATEPSLGGRLAVVMNRAVNPGEYGLVWDAISHLLGDGFDEVGASVAQCYGQHACRSADTKTQRIILPGGVLDADALIELGQTLQPVKPQYDNTESKTPHKHRGLAEEIERIKLMGAVRPPNDYEDWFSGAAAFKREYPDDEQRAFLCFDAWSACSLTDYKDSEDARRKFDQVSADYDGPAIPVTVAMLYSAARRRAIKVLNTLYPAEQGEIVIAEVFKRLPVEDLAEGIEPGKPAKGDEPIEPGSIGPKDGMIALEFLLFCFGEKTIEGTPIPQHVLDKARALTNDRRERIDLNGRILHIWDGKDIAADTGALSDAILASNAKLNMHGGILIRIASPASNPAVARRIRELHKYKGKPGDPDDPAQGKGMRQVPILGADKSTLRAIIAEHIATKKLVKRGKKTVATICSFAFKGNADTLDEPDGGVLDNLLRQVLPEGAPEIRGIITAPVMPNLPTSTTPKALLRPDADYLITDPRTGLFLAPIGTIVDISAKPSRKNVEAAADILRMPWLDFPIASPGGDLNPAVSRSIAIYGTMIAANRRALDIAPGIAIDSHAEGMSNGKTLAGKLICAIATGEEAIPVVLSTHFDEQRKALITHLVMGNGALLIDNIMNGVRVDSAALAAIQTSPKFKDRLLGANKEIEANTQVMIVLDGNALNLAGDLASRNLKMRLDTGLERPEDRETANFKIQDLLPWVIENRQRIVAAAHTIVRGYLLECRNIGRTPDDVAARRKVPGSRFGGPVEVIRDAFLWAFPTLPDPFLGFEASTLSSSTRQEKTQVLHLLDDKMAEMAGRQVPAQVVAKLESLRVKFLQRWKHMALARRQRWKYPHSEAQEQTWRYVLEPHLHRRYGRSEVRAGRVKFSSSEILVEALPHSELHGALQAMLPNKEATTLNSITLGRWLKNGLVDAPIDGLVMRAAQIKNTAHFWIEQTAKNKK